MPLIEAAAGHLYTGVWHRRVKSQMIGSHVNNYCSKLLNLVTIQIGLTKSDGSWTYLPLMLPIIATSLNALKDTDQYFWYIMAAVKRMNAAVAALSGQKNMLDIKLCQLVNLLHKGKPVKMSKRAGTFVTLQDVLDAVGAVMLSALSCLPDAMTKHLILTLQSHRTIAR